MAETLEMSPIERAARELHKLYTEEKERSGATNMPAWEELGEDGVFYFTHRVRAVLQAIREPSEAMVQAGGEVVYDNRENGLSVQISHASWQAMIDAALAD